MARLQFFLSGSECTTGVSQTVHAYQRGVLSGLVGTSLGASCGLGNPAANSAILARPAAAADLDDAARCSEAATGRTRDLRQAVTLLAGRDGASTGPVQALLWVIADPPWHFPILRWIFLSLVTLGLPRHFHVSGHASTLPVSGPAHECIITDFLSLNMSSHLCL